MSGRASKGEADSTTRAMTAMQRGREAKGASTPPPDPPRIQIPPDCRHRQNRTGRIPIPRVPGPGAQATAAARQPVALASRRRCGVPAPRRRLLLRRRAPAQRDAPAGAWGARAHRARGLPRRGPAAGGRAPRGAVRAVRHRGRRVGDAAGSGGGARPACAAGPQVCGACALRGVSRGGGGAASGSLPPE